MNIILRQTSPEPIHGYWDGGAKQRFAWSLDHIDGHDSNGTFTRVSSFEANHWFNVAKGRTDKITLCNAMKHLRGTKLGRASRFEYVETED